MKKRFKNTPSWVLPALVAVTFVCQGLPPIFEANEVITDKTASIVKLVCDVINVSFAGLSVFFTKTEK